jgi:L-lysine exporter family protein LysE/ArgO
VTALVSGLAFGLSLIVAIGAQNSFVIRQGALRAHVATVVAICSLSDVALIAAGVAGAGAVLQAAPAAMSAVRIAGAAALLAYALFAARRARRPGTGAARESATAPSARRGVIAATLAFTWLNPAVYLDTVVLLGSVANSRPGHAWVFGAGAALGSVAWFCALGFGARLLSPLLRRPGAWRALDGFVAAVMTVTAVRVLLGG